MRYFFALHNMVNWFARRRSGVNIPHPFIYAVAADRLPKDRIPTEAEIRDAASVSIELANCYAAAVERLKR